MPTNQIQKHQPQHTQLIMLQKKKEKYSKDIKENDFIKIRDILLKLSAEDFFRFYSERKSYEEIPLLTADGIVIPEIGLQAALSKKEYTNIVPTIAGSNRDEGKALACNCRIFRRIWIPHLSAPY